MATHVISGAGSGIGAVLADRLHDRGDQLWLLARSEERAAELGARCSGARTLVADLADPGGLERTLAEADLPDGGGGGLHGVLGGVLADLGPAQVVLHAPILRAGPPRPQPAVRDPAPVHARAPGLRSSA